MGWVVLLWCLQPLVFAEVVKMTGHTIPQAEGVTYPAALQKRLREALASKGPGYRPRTRHLLADGSPKYTNRLILEDSPYLLQHAHNPVDWYPWGEEAFAQARREGKPVFLSIGYSTCHWCHVMEEQSFEDPEIAAILNRYFIAIKVDREQRPDVDATYMNGVQLLTGSGGWPLSSFLTPDGKLFFGGTYFPPGQFRQLLLRVAEGWKSQREAIEKQAAEIAAAVARMNEVASGANEFDPSLVERALTEVVGRFDPNSGGFGQAPKFPNEPWLFLLVDELWRNDDGKVLHVLEKTLDAMARGGIYDQIGGGFHRYATDAAWQVPHFEKMLYNQAQLGLIYTQAAVLTGNAFFERVARQTFDYVLREMTSPEGGFYSATDADSEGQEGKFFVWTPNEVKAALSPQDAELALEVFGITRHGNFEGRNILHLPKPLSQFAREKQIDEATLLVRLDRIRARLYQIRKSRVPPLRDDKIITAWNGMMIASLAEAGRLLHEPKYIHAASGAARFLWQHHYRDGRLLRASLHGNASGDGVQEDYAWFSLGLLNLYDVTADRSWLAHSEALATSMSTEFWDEDQGGFYMNRGESGPLMVRPKDLYDGALPSGNSVAARLLAHLQRRSPQLLFQTRFHALSRSVSQPIQRSPGAIAYFLIGYREFVQGETGPLQYAARGQVRISVLANGGVLQVTMAIRDGWHVNGPETHQDLVATTIELHRPARGWQLGKVDYPPPEAVILPFSKVTLPLYRRRVSFQVALSRHGKEPVPLQIQLQACNDKQCLAPETVQLQIPKNKEKRVIPLK